MLRILCVIVQSRLPSGVCIACCVTSILDFVASTTCPFSSLKSRFRCRVISLSLSTRYLPSESAGFLSSMRSVAFALLLPLPLRPPHRLLQAHYAYRCRYAEALVLGGYQHDEVLAVSADL